ncbi:hypothetical protein SADUNF_Sadunf17G0021300 [Salix dunnii]|uniref:SUI1 domain-containing protein n=1 Tax=Salix dunnii TaxID=1413687 RepID=A0A835MEJ4_9ROSI|nr:hypothetical protein SADUNF_Sadunf17G0021300 [Salix dunnii]
MSEFDNVIPTAFDYVHVRAQQRNGRKNLITVQGLKREYSYSKILKDLKKELCCNGTVVQDPELGQVIQPQGDQRKSVSPPHSGWHCEEGKHQDSWFLSSSKLIAIPSYMSRAVIIQNSASLPCVLSNFISGYSVFCILIKKRKIVCLRCKDVCATSNKL